MTTEAVASRQRRPRGAECQCCACDRFFTSPSAFDAHQKAGPKGRRLGESPVECLDPTEAGLVSHERKGGPTWGLPSDDSRWA